MKPHRLALTLLSTQLWASGLPAAPSPHAPGLSGRSRPAASAHLPLSLALAECGKTASTSDHEDVLNTLGDDTEMTQMDLQNAMQRQSQTMSMLSALLKVSHDTLMSIIQNLKG
jgi:hypothetical protein